MRSPLQIQNRAAARYPHRAQQGPAAGLQCRASCRQPAYGRPQAPRRLEHCDKTPAVSPVVPGFWAHWRDRAPRLRIAAKMLPEVGRTLEAVVRSGATRRRRSPRIAQRSTQPEASATSPEA
ncbi:MAG TPA: hypothetical protein PL078_06580 [Bacillota bacterium]|nr:hypothetical protein [Bacillota bacterium]HQD75778.1 hypothetical protein [Bacillota bacterium]